MKQITRKNCRPVNVILDWNTNGSLEGEMKAINQINLIQLRGK